MANDERQVTQDAVSLEAISQRIVPEEREDRLYQNTGDGVKKRKRKKKKKKILQQASSDQEGNTQVKVFYAEEHTTQIDVLSIEKEDTTNSPQKHHQKTPKEKRASCIVLCLKGLIMFAAVVLISSSENISKAKPCDLEKALKSISLNHYFPCNHHDIKDDSSTLRKLGIALLVVNFIFFLLILIFPLLLPVCKLLVRTFILLVAISSAFTIMEYRSIFSLKAEEKDMVCKIFHYS
eukprot:XP_019920830.1 PREDICTED: uncharacterized protein LOC105323355 [Crassostrea gigas]